MHLVTRGYFRSCDKDGDHIIRSAISENPMLHANFTVLSFSYSEKRSTEITSTEKSSTIGKTVHGNKVHYRKKRPQGNKVHLQRVRKKVHESRKISPQHPVSV